MDIRLFKTFLLVAELLNITKAAEQLNFSQPAVTAQISSLEESFHVRLFLRQGKRLSLTEAGIQMVDYARRIVSLYDEAYNAMAVFQHGDNSLRLGVSTQMINYFLPSLLIQLQNALPHLHISVAVCMNTFEVLKGVTECRYDMGFIHGTNTLTPLHQHEIWIEKFLWVASPQLIASSDKEKAITHFPLVNYTEGSVARTKLEELMSIDDFRSSIEYSDSEAIKRAVIAGLGISYLPQTLVMDEIDRGKLIVLYQGPPIHLCISMVHRSNKTVTHPMRELLRLLAEQPDAAVSLQNLL